MRRSKGIALSAAALTGIGFWSVASVLVGGFKVGRETSFYIFAGLFAAGLVYLLVHRLINGPELDRDEWILIRKDTSRPEPLPTAQMLERRLQRHGFAVTISGSDLWKKRVSMTDAKLGHGELRLELGNGVAPFFGTVEIDDNPRATYAVLATCVIFELGELISDLAFKRTYSTLVEEPTHELAQLLPTATKEAGRP